MKTYTLSTSTLKSDEEYLPSAVANYRVQKNLQNAGDQLEEVMGKRTRAIERKLRQVEALPKEDSQKMLHLEDFMDED